MPSPQHPSSTAIVAGLRRLRPVTWIGIAATVLVAILGLATGGFWSMLAFIALVILGTAIYGFAFRRPTWMRLPRKRSAAAIGAGIALAVIIGSGAASGATDPVAPSIPHSVAVASSVPATHRAAVKTPTPTPTPVTTTKLVTTTAPVPFSSSNVNDGTLNKGTNHVTTTGANGVETTTYRVTLTDGVETSRAQISKTVTTPPVNQVTHIGTYVAPAPAPAAPAPPVDSSGGATAKCNDGSLSYAAHHQGACSHHGGVAIFYK